MKERERGLFWRALGCLALAGAVFVIVYSGCNRFTATRQDVGSFYFEWERSLPFVPWLVVPYWTLDLFFCGAFFLCGTRAELGLLTRRLITVVLASAVCYLLFPLKFGWDRPEPTGWTAPLFHALYANDLPFNLAPSLHISLRSLVWVALAAHLRGWLRTTVKIWFIIIGLSTLLLWQHHLIDVVGGFVMGWLIQVLIPATPRRTVPRTRAHLKLAAGIGGIAILFSGLALLGGGWLWFAWPAVAFGIVAMAYLFRDPRLLGKENGTLSPAAEWCLLPWLLIACAVQHSHLGGVAAREIHHGLLLGRRHTQREAAALVAAGPLAVLDLTAEGNAPHAFREQALYQNLPLLDLVPPTGESLAEAVEFIRTHHPHRTVLVHCQLGLFRSAAVTAAWLVQSGAVPDHAGAVELIRRVNPRVRLV
jgi:membrane-associated phospholipid phosphatase